VHHERRSAPDKNYVDCFLERLNSLSNDYPLELVLNMDETGWKLIEAPQKFTGEKDPSRRRERYSMRENIHLSGYLQNLDGPMRAEIRIASDRKTDV
jgi:hypothetical protein